MKHRRLTLALLQALVILACARLVPPCAAASSGYNSGPPSSTGQSEAKSLVGQRAKHETDLFTGSFVYSIPIEGAPARNGSEPHLSLVYSSRGENGPFGVGWNLDVGYIERYTSDGVPIKWDTATPPSPLKQYDDGKGFICSLFGKQVRLLVHSGNEYRAETDTDFTRYVFDTTNNRWTAYDKSGNQYRFGYVASARMVNPNTGWGTTYTATFRWALTEIITSTGDQTTITYQSPGTGRVLYPDVISYNGHVSMNGNTAVFAATHTIDFDLEARTDKRLSYRSGFRVLQDQRVNRITCKVGPTQKVRQYDLSYLPSTSTKRSRLSSVIVNGFAIGSSTPVPLPAQTFTYQDKPFSLQAAVNWMGMNIPNASESEWKVVAGGGAVLVSDLTDIDGDGLPDRVRRKRLSFYDNFLVQRTVGVQGGGTAAFDGTDFNWGPTPSQSKQTDPEWSAINSQYTRFLDINADGKPDRVMDYAPSYQGAQYDQFIAEANTGTGFSGDTAWSGVQIQGAGEGVFKAIENSGYVRMIDINGDARPDRVMYESPLGSGDHYLLVQLNTGTGFSAKRRFGPYRSQEQYSWDWASLHSGNVSLIDINADGLPDRVMLPVNASGFPVRDATLNKFVVEFNNGASFEQADWTGVEPQYNVQNGTTTDYCYVLNHPFVGLFDINGDGLPDRVMCKDSDHTKWLVQLNNGIGFDPSSGSDFSGIDNQGNPNDPLWYGINGVDIAGQLLTQMIDMNGDGLIDRVMTEDTSYNGGTTFNGFKVQLNSGPFPDLLTTANNGFGGSSSIQYKPSTYWDNRLTAGDGNSAGLLPFPVQTVNTVSDSDGLNASRTTEYQYEGGFYDGSRREFSGFAKVTVKDPSLRFKVYYFHQGGGRDNGASGEFADAGAFAKKGMPYRIETYGNNSPTPLLYNVIVNQVDQASLTGSRWFPFVKHTLSFDYPGGGTANTAATKFEYDSSTGNLTKKILYGKVTGITLSTFAFTDETAADTQYHQLSYAAITGNADIKDRPATVSLTSDYAGNTVVNQTKYTYYANHGSLNTEETRICPGTFGIETHFYDSYGRRYLTTDAAGNQTYIESFDASYQIYPTSTRQRVTPNQNNTADHITTTTYDARSGLVSTSTDPTGVQIANTYDAFHRLTRTDRTPIGGSAFWTKLIDYNLGGMSSGISANSVRVRVKDGVDAVNGIESWAYADGFGRVIEARTEAEATGTSGFRVVNTVYDERGEVLLVTWPRFESGSAYTKPPTSPVPALFTGFDPAGRENEKRRRVDATFDSAGKYVSKQDSLGDPTTSPLGARSWQYANGTDPWWIIATDEEDKVRRYRLDAFGRTNRIEEVDGASTYVTTLNYDLSGNLVEIINHSSEHVYFGYDETGKMVAMADPHLGQWTYRYDVAGRLREQTDAKGQKTTFTYGATLGRLSVKNVYNAASQLVSTATYTYDSSGDPNYPVYKGLLYQVIDSEGWEKRGYDTHGRLTKTTRHLNVKNQDYTTTHNYNNGDQLTSIIYPNSGPTISYTYHPSGSIYQVSRPGYTYYQAAAGSFDEFGHVTQFSFPQSGAVTTRAYFLVSKRLQSLAATGAGSILSKSYQYNKSDDVTAIGATAITYDNLHRIKTYTGLTGNYTYDSVGNITATIEGGGSSYGYGNARKQAVKSAFAKAYRYDECGNMIVRGAQALDYDAENRLTRLSQPGSVVVEFGYAVDGTRLWKRKNQTELQVWIGSLYEEKQGKTLFHVFAGDQRVCTFEPGSVLGGGAGGAGTHVGYYYHQDHLGSSSALSGSSGQLLEANTWYAFGGVQAATPQATFQVSSRFTGQVLDAETGLYYYNARYYDPELGRFIQADTIIPDIGNPQSYNRYTYCLNNPLKYIDPSGRESYWEGVGNVFLGYYDAGVGMVKGTAFAIAHPIRTAQGVGAAVAHPITTAQAVWEATQESWQSGTRGQGKLVANVLLAAGSAVAPGAQAGNISKIGQVANVTSKAEEVTKVVASVQSVGTKAAKMVPNPVAGEDLFVGLYGQTRRANIKSGLNATHTPHHVLQDAVSGTSHSQGVTINLRKDLHKLTRTYGRNADLGSNVRNLATDVRDLRSILRDAGYDRSLVNQQMQRLIEANRQVGNVPR